MSCGGDQARAIRKNGWLSELEIEVIKRKISQGDAEDVNVVSDSTRRAGTGYSG